MNCSNSSGERRAQGCEGIAAGAPEPVNCRAESILLGRDAAWCLTNPRRACSYALPFGSSFLCVHPDRDVIVARTRANPPSAPGSV